MKDAVVYFELDNWFCGRDYPNAEPFISWMGNDYALRFRNDEWCKQNKLCVKAGLIDMSVCFCIAASRQWVEANCPDLLTDKECGAKFISRSFDKEQGKWVEKEHYESKKFSDFICKPDEDGDVEGRVSGWSFPEYCEENYGVEWYDEDADYDDNDDDEDEE